MRYIIDAFNLIFQDTQLQEAQDERGFNAAQVLLCARLARFAAGSDSTQIVAVFDGSPRGSRTPATERGGTGNVSVVHTGVGKKADGYIVELIEAERDRQQFTVVSTDKFIANSARKAGAHVLSCKEFLRLMRETKDGRKNPRQGEDPRKFKGLTDWEVQEWMDYFGFTEKD